MSLVLDYLRDLYRGVTEGWNAFWFTPTSPATLSLIRVLAGAMLLYTHGVWGLALVDFFGPEGWLPPSSVARFQHSGPTWYGPETFAWSYLWWVHTPAALWTLHVLALGVFVLLTVGLWTRVVAVLAAVITIAYANRAPGALFGLDQINTYLACYLALGPSGAFFSVDAWRSRRAGAAATGPAASAAANLALRLLQVHMCVIYLFAGLSKLGGPMWWNGTALWGAFVNLEYQSVDMLWMVHAPLVVNAMTLATLAWEISYPALVWNRLARPIVVLLAIPLHLGIAVCLGMITFGLAMLIGNASFISPELVERFCVWPWQGRAAAPEARPPSAERPRGRGSMPDGKEARKPAAGGGGRRPQAT